MKSVLLILSIFALSAITSGRPNDLKANFIEDNEIPDKKVLKKGVSASFGGYQASAGLGGGAGGGGLYASAGIPEAGASAGIGSFGSQSSAAAGAGVSGFDYGKPSGFDYGRPRPPVQAGDGFFDRIFAIPINVLHSVNDYVKTKASQGQGVYIENGAGNAGAAIGQGGVAASASTGNDNSPVLSFGGSSGEASVAGSSASASSGSYAGAGASAGATAGAGAGVGVGQGFKHGGRPDYDRIFNIPISALRSVNEFLNG